MPFSKEVELCASTFDKINLTDNDSTKLLYEKLQLLLDKLRRCTLLLNYYKCLFVVKFPDKYPCFRPPEGFTDSEKSLIKVALGIDKFSLGASIIYEIEEKHAQSLEQLLRNEIPNEYQCCREILLVLHSMQSLNLELNSSLYNLNIFVESIPNFFSYLNYNIRFHEVEELEQYKKTFEYVYLTLNIPPEQSNLKNIKETLNDEIKRLGKLLELERLIEEADF